MEFDRMITLHKHMSSHVPSLPFKCLGKSTQISVVEDLKADYVLKIKKGSSKKPCRFCCIKKLTNVQKLRVIEDESYITIQSI